MEIENGPARPKAHWFTAALLGATLLSRIALLSAPYYVDGPNHVKAVQDGSLFIQPPGYFLFAFSARLLALISHLSASGAISVLNVAFSVAGVWIFSLIVTRWFPGAPGRLLACCYAASNVVWFAAEIHSTYASMTFFAPLLLYVLVVRGSVRWAWLVWAILAGFRPSDGVFLLPFMLYASANAPVREGLIGIAMAAPVCALWYVPTVAHFGGLLAPLSAANRQLGQLPSGLLVHGFTAKGLNNLLHFAFGSGNAWNLLLPFVVIGFLEKDRIKWLCVAWMAPAVLFFALYFVSDSMYLAFLVAPGMVLAGFGLRRALRTRAMTIVAAASVLAACIQMLALRPIVPHSVPVAILDSYVLEYSGWALKHQYARRLSSTIEELHKK